MKNNGFRVISKEPPIRNKDHVETPKWVVQDMYNRINIKKYRNVWLPFNHLESEFRQEALNNNLSNFKATHIFDDLQNDFFITKPPNHCDLIISNPPFSIQNQILERLFELNIPFAMLLPLRTLETEPRGNLFEKYNNDIQILIFKKRIKFKGCTTSFNQGCVWICYKLNIQGKQIQWI
ncbi:sugar-phosphate nucleotidyltransferase [Spiroplasma sp. DGKH1]|uniref:sugar-phosphate nucleotidyltransferase n=1 Tax=Spiroplasma sp. DGKH1 TaxID=3050074 RepID=UPI0034C61A57